MILFLFWNICTFLDTFVPKNILRYELVPPDEKVSVIQKFSFIVSKSNKSTPLNFFQKTGKKIIVWRFPTSEKLILKIKE